MLNGKKITAFLLSIVMFCCAGSFAVVGEEAEAEPVNAAQKEAQAAESGMPVEIKAKAAVLMDGSTGKLLLAQQEHERLAPASVTKIMTLLLIVEAVDSGKIALTDVVTASPDACAKGGSQIWLKEGEKMTVDELLKASAVGSANDACVALAEYIAGSEEAFVGMMNERAKALGMNDTNFENCTGLDDTTTDHLTSAYDIALMSKELIQHDLIKNYTTIWMDSLRGGETQLVNTNKLVRFYKGTTGLKTGTTNKAGSCLSATAERDGTSLIAVVLGSANSNDRFDSAKAMLNWGFSNWSTFQPELDASLITPVAVLHGTQDAIQPVVPQPDRVLIRKGSQGQIMQNVTLCVDVEAPVEAGQVLGEVTLTLNGETLGSYPLVAPEAVGKLSFSVAFRRVLTSLASHKFGPEGK